MNESERAIDALKLIHQGVSIVDASKVTGADIELVRSLVIEKESSPEIPRAIRRREYSQELCEKLELGIMGAGNVLIEKVQADILADDTSEDGVTRTKRLSMQVDMVSKLMNSMKKSPSNAINIIQNSGGNLSEVIENKVIDVSKLSQ